MEPNSREFTDAQILIVDNDDDSAIAIRAGLAEFKNVHVFGEGEQALRFCRTHTPDLIILDVHMPKVDGWTICRRLREMSLLTRCPIIFLTSCEEERTELACWESGGSDFLRKPVSPAALNMRVMSHLTTHWHIEIQSRLFHTDPLTGLFNRYYYEKHIKEQVSYATRYKSDMSLLIIDVDDFEQFNKKHGYDESDKCLKRIAQILRKNVNRVPDCLCRYGAEEFVVVMPGTDLKGATCVADKLTEAVLEADISGSDVVSEKVTISIGSASLVSLGNTGLSLIEKANQALSVAKQNQSKVV